MKNRQFYFTIHGEGVSPETVPVNDLFDLVKHFQTAVRSADNSTNKDDDPMFFSLVGVREGSDTATLNVSSQAGIVALRRVATSISEDRISDLPPAAQKSLRSIWTLLFNRGYESVEFVGNGIGFGSASIRATDDPPGPKTLKGITTLYGQNVKTGGSQRPSSEIKLAGRKRAVAFRLANKELAEELGHLLYSTVGLEGEATWDPDTGDLVGFIAQKLSPYQHRGGERKSSTLKHKFAALSELDGERWNDIDVDKFVSDLRGE